jgi:hypothetical protein
VNRGGRRRQQRRRLSEGGDGDGAPGQATVGRQRGTDSVHHHVEAREISRIGGAVVERHDPAAQTTGGFFYHRRPADAHPAARDPELQDRLLAYCAQVSGIALA